MYAILILTATIAVISIVVIMLACRIRRLENNFIDLIKEMIEHDDPYPR